MHVVAGLSLTSMWQVSKATGDDLGGMMEMFLGQLPTELVVCAALSEPGTSWGFPLTEAAPTDGGWLINGRKIFATNSPFASVIMTAVRVKVPGMDDQLGFLFAFRDTPGMEILDNWDALGMRASGSNDIVFKDCFLPEAMVMPMSPWGQLNDLLVRISASGAPGLVAVFLGIAEAAHEHAVSMVKTRRKAPSGRVIAERVPVQITVAESEIDLAASRAMLARTCDMIDQLWEPGTVVDLAEAHRVHKDIQCTKTFVQRRAVEIVDRALTLSGGSGFMSASPLSRYYRDVRAGPFMQPFSPNEAFEYIGKVSLGFEPTLDI
jgi:alkylation response protein AidB-like acyl-CoA dehydrogenase